MSTPLPINNHQDNSFDSWFLHRGGDFDVLLSSRIVLYRNLADHLFPQAPKFKADPILLKEILDFLESLSWKGQHLRGFLLQNISSHEKGLLIERRLLSPRIKAEHHGALLTDPTEELLISLFHQDHFRFHCLAPGQSLLEQLIPLLKLAQEVEEHYPFSKSEKGDYLCARAEEAGLALRASLMAQFIMLQELEELDPHIFQLMKKGYSLRGFTDNRDEDSQSSLGGFYQIYSQARGAEDPQEVLNTMLMDLDPLIQRERDLRQELKQGRFPWVEDRINRSFGILKYCKLISSNEAQKRLSYIRLGVTLGWIDGLSLQEVSAMQILVQDRHICAGFNQAEPGPFALDEERARFIREVFERGLPYRR